MRLSMKAFCCGLRVGSVPACFCAHPRKSATDPAARVSSALGLHWTTGHIISVRNIMRRTGRSAHAVGARAQCKPQPEIVPRRRVTYRLTSSLNQHTLRDERLPPQCTTRSTRAAHHRGLRVTAIQFS